MRLANRLARGIFTRLNRVRLALRKATGVGRPGVHALPLTPEGRIVLVRLNYAPGWRVPGGGRKRGEAPDQAILRELREEIGLVSHGAVERLEDERSGSDGAGGGSAFFVVRDIVYRPRWSLEVAKVGEFDPGDLPEDTAEWTVHLVERFGGR